MVSADCEAPNWYEAEKDGGKIKLKKGEPGYEEYGEFLGKKEMWGDWNTVVWAKTGNTKSGWLKSGRTASG